MKFGGGNCSCSWFLLLSKYGVLRLNLLLLLLLDRILWWIWNLLLWDDYFFFNFFYFKDTVSLRLSFSLFLPSSRSATII